MPTPRNGGLAGRALESQAASQADLVDAYATSSRGGAAAAPVRPLGPNPSGAGTTRACLSGGLAS